MIGPTLPQCMIIQNKKLDELAPSPYNPRSISDQQLERLKNSIEKFDLVEPIIWNKQTGHVVGGHQRLEVLKTLGKTETQVVVVDLNPIDEKALNLALNKISGEWDLPKLKDLIIELDTEDFPIELTGFDYQELGELIDYPNQDLISEPEDDQVPDPPKQAITKLGDLWALGNHRLFCGDCTQIKDIDQLMGKEKANMVFTDPPYNVDYEDKAGRKIKNDNLKDFKAFILKAYQSIIHLSDENSSAYICYAERNVIDFLSAALEAGWTYRNTLIWLKDNAVINFGHYTCKCEPILYLVKGAPKFYGQKNHSNVFEAPSFSSFAGRKDDKGNPASQSLHPNQKPVELISKILVNSSQKNDIVADVFGGSGSTLIACEKLERQARLMELDPTYCDLIIERWQTFTGQTAQRING